MGTVWDQPALPLSLKVVAERPVFCPWANILKNTAALVTGSVVVYIQVR